MHLFRRPATTEDSDPEFAWCEPVTATPTSPQHIRKVGPEGLKLGGGIPTPTLCDRDLRGGWDLKGPVTPEQVRLMSQPRDGDGRIFACKRCADAYLTQTPISERPDRHNLTGLHLINPTTGNIEGTLTFTPDEIDMPGYIEHIERGYDTTEWEPRRIWRSDTNDQPSS